MTSPVGHVLGGLIVAEVMTQLVSRKASKPGHVRRAGWMGWGGLAFILLAANFADLDFLPGALVGEFSRFHHQATHSFAAAWLFALVLYGFFRWRNAQAPTQALVARHWAVLGGTIYLSHLLLDSLTLDEVPPFGSQLLWPFSSQYWILPWTPFVNVMHGDASAGLMESLQLIFSWHNLYAVVVEAAILLPIYGLIWWSGQRFVFQEDNKLPRK